MRVHFFEKIKNHPKRAVSLIAVVIILVPMLINVLMYFRIPTSRYLHAPDWLGFWGAYIGGLVGTISGLIALFATYKQAERHHADDLENRRLSVIPVIDLHFLPVTTLPTEASNLDWCFTMDEHKGFSVEVSSLPDIQKYITTHPKTCFYLKVTNIGIGPALGVAFFLNDFNLSIGAFSSSNKREYIFAVPKHDGTDKTYDLRILFTDVFGNEYTQIQKIGVTAEMYSFHAITRPQFVGEKSINPF